jgi:hypothetical protein
MNSKAIQPQKMAKYFHPMAVMAMGLTKLEKKPPALPKICSTPIPRLLTAYGNSSTR